MKYTLLGNTDIKVSSVCVGCMSFGKAGTMHDWTLDENQTEKVVQDALSLGINFFDTANGYSAGTSEEYLGRAIKNNIARDKVVIASKVYFNPGRLSSEAIHREIDGSLKRLGTDYLDLYIIHRFDYETPIEETMEANTDTLRSKTDCVAMGKYDSTQQQDMEIVRRVHELSLRYGVKMQQIALAWHWAKGVSSPIIGATKAAHLEDAAKALDIQLSEEDVAYLEEAYVPHRIVGAIDHNPAEGVMLLDEKK